LKKRAAYVQAFDGFDAHKIARYGDRKVQELLANPEIVRNRLKIQAAVNSA
jgi:DNA-3-methyladenine glycosylase I